jgi:hypothetical protein
VIVAVAIVGVNLLVDLSHAALDPRVVDRAAGKIYGRGRASALPGLKPTTLAYRTRALGIRRRRPESTR